MRKKRFHSKSIQLHLFNVPLHNAVYRSFNYDIIMSSIRVTHWFPIFLDLWKINLGVIFIILTGSYSQKALHLLEGWPSIWLMNSDTSPLISWASSEGEFLLLRTLGWAKSPPLWGSKDSNWTLLITQHMAGGGGLSWFLLSPPRLFFCLLKDLTDMIGKLAGNKQGEMLLKTSAITHL